MANETLEYRFTEKGLRDLRKDMQKLASDIEDTGDEWDALTAKAEAGGENMEDSIHDVDRALDNISTRSALVAIARLDSALEDVEDKIDRLDGQRIDVNTDIDRDRVAGGGGGGGSRSRGGGRIPMDPEGLIQGFMQLPAHIQAFTAATIAATAAVAGGAGLAAAATAAAGTLGDKDLRQDIQQLKNRFRGVGVAMVSEFEPVIRNRVIPAAESFADSIEDASDDLAVFSEWAIGTAAGGGRAVDEETPGTVMMQGTKEGFWGMLWNSVMPNADRVGNLLPDEQPGANNTTQGSGGDGGIGGFINNINVNEVKKARKEIDKIRDKMEHLPGFTTKEGLQEIKQVKTELWSTVRAKAKAQGIDLNAIDFEAIEGAKTLKGLLQDILGISEKVEGINAEDLGLRENLEGDPTMQGPVEAQETGHANAPTVSQEELNLNASLPLSARAETLLLLDKRLQRINARPFMPNARKSKQSINAVVSGIRQLQSQGQLLSKTALKGFLQDLDLSAQKIQKVISKLRQQRKQQQQTGAGARKMARLARGMGSAFSRAFQKGIEGGKSFLDAMEGIVKQLLKRLTALIVKLAAAKALKAGLDIGTGGISLLGSSLVGIFGGVAQGGMGAMMGRSTNVPTNTIPPSGPSPTMKSKGMNINVTVQGESRIEGRDIKQSYDTETRVRSRQGIE